MENRHKSNDEGNWKSLIRKMKFFRVSSVLILIFAFILMTQRQANYFPALLSSNTALLAIFIKIEWDEYKEKWKNRYNNKRLILAYYNELKNMELVFNHNQYRKRKDAVDLEIIDEKMQEAEWKEKQVDVYYNKAIKDEIERGLYNIEQLEVRLSNHENLEKSIKNMLLESTMPISANLFEELWNVQRQYHKLYIKPLEYDKLREKISGTMIPLNTKYISIKYEYWKEVYKVLKSIEIKVMLDEHMEIMIKNMIKELEKDK